MDILSRLNDDELLHVLSHLGVADLGVLAQASKRCKRVATCDSAWKAHALGVCSRYKLDRHDFEGNFLYELKERPLLPFYKGPTIHSMIHGCDLVPTNGAFGIKLCDEGLQYQCYPCHEHNLKSHERSYTWIVSKFPVVCCGALHATRADFAAHCLDMRHYESACSPSARMGGCLIV